MNLSLSSRPLSDFGFCDEAAISFADFLRSAVRQSVPRTSGHFPKHPVPSWNADCTNAVKENLSAFSRARPHRGDPQCLEFFRRVLALERLTLRKGQRRSSKVYFSSITVRTLLTEVFNNVRKMTG